MSASTNGMFATDLGWINELAKNEINPEAPNVYNEMSKLDPRTLIEESAIQMLENLHDLFADFARAFNAHSEAGAKYSEVKIYGITNTPADFMIFRNNVKLVFANTAHGIINVSFSQHNRVERSVDSGNTVALSQQSKDIIAQMGPFMDIKWTFQGEVIDLEKFAKYYFVEFTKASRMQPKESTNQLLLKQIKALLEEKGINI